MREAGASAAIRGGLAGGRAARSVPALPEGQEWGKAALTPALGSFAAARRSPTRAGGTGGFAAPVTGFLCSLWEGKCSLRTRFALEGIGRKTNIPGVGLDTRLWFNLKNVAFWMVTYRTCITYEQFPAFSSKGELKDSLLEFCFSSPNY